MISTSVVGLVFNLDIGVYQRTDSGLSLNLAMLEAQADTATTSVTVQNAAPVFVGNAAEVKISTSTSPINVGDTITFSGSANDPEDNSFYLIICSSDGATAGAGGTWPSCTDTTFCTSTLTADLGTATCDYTNVADPPGETEDWWGFVCDNHTGEPDCAASDQGASPNLGDDSSPFYVNHAPSMTASSTSINNQDPGGTFQFSVTTNDTDTTGGEDEITLHICETAGYATSTGCSGTELCTATSSTSGGTANVSCQWTDTAPTADQDYPYYIYVQDWHGFAGTNNGSIGTYTVNNVAPTVSNVNLLPNQGSVIRLNIKGATSTLIYATSSSVSDQNGCTDIQSATGTIYYSDVSNDHMCAANNNYCYPASSAECIISGCVGAIASVTCSTTLEFFAIPTDSSSYGASSSIWKASIRAFDEALSGVGTTSPGTEMQTTIALDVTEIGIDYGLLQAGSDTGTDTSTTTVINYGNSPIDTDMSGTWMVDAQYFIGANYQEYSLTNQFAWGTGTDLSSTTPARLDTDIDRPQNATDLTDDIYWGIGLPLTQHSGNYYGTNTIAALIDDYGSWFP